MMTAWWRWSGNLKLFKGREKRGDLKLHREGHDSGKGMLAREVDQLGRSQGRAQHKTGRQDRDGWREKVVALCASWDGELTN